MLKIEWGAESNGKLPHLFIPGKTAALVPEFMVKLQPCFLSLRWNCSPGSCTCGEGPALGQKTSMTIIQKKNVCALRLHGQSVNFYGDRNHFEIKFCLFTHNYYINTL